MKFRYQRPSDIDEVRDWLSKKKGEYTIEVKRVQHTRSINQNSFYWALVKDAAMEMGELQEDVHEMFKRAYNSRTLHVKGHDVKIGGSTKHLTKEEFTDFLTKVKAFCIKELNMVIPETPGHVREYEMYISNRYGNYVRQI